MKWEHEGTLHENCATFRKTKEEFGGLSNMASGFLLKVNGHEILSSEALYQACRYPDHAEIQREILEQASPMGAKMRSKKDKRRERFTRADWQDVSVDIMRWCLRVKLAQNLGPFYWLLHATGERMIVELSHNDSFWGAVVDDDGILRGRNLLGLLLVELREQAKSRWDSDRDSLKLVEPLAIPNFQLLGEEIRAISP